MSEERVGFIGLGQMGGGIVERLLASGYSVVVYDVNRDAVAVATASGAEAAESPADLATKTGRIFVCVPSSHEVEAVCLGENGIAETAAAESVVVDLTSGEPSMTVAIAQGLAERNVRMLDGALSGARGANRAAIERADLTVMIGGEPQLIDRCRPHLETFASTVIHVGPLGAGHLTKALNNMLVATYLLATSEVIAIAASAGLDPLAVVRAIDHSSGKNFATGKRFPEHVIPGDYGPAAGGPLKYLHKDIGQALDVARAHDAPSVIGPVVQSLVSIGMREVGGDRASTALATLYERWGGRTFREATEAFEES
jgi:3-hydroxyisobutyrate dehydrogenase-like beta-hydroxyacid dehydrogenase